VFARQNRTDEVRPWATISAVAPIKLHGDWIKMEMITNAMWLTDEYAIRDFRSVCHKQIELVITMPHSESSINGYIMWFVTGDRRMVTRIITYPPSFSRTAASTMEPAIGASTWALGSHRCSPYNGILTINAIIHASQSRSFDHDRFSCSE
jgi:hypothetical protein